MFDSARSALRWSSLMRSILIIDGSSINDMCGKPRISTTNDILHGLSPQEAQQQAANIFNYVDKLNDPVCSQYLHAKYFFSQSIDGIVQRLMSNIIHAPGGTSRRDISVIVLAYLGHKITRREMRKKLQCRMTSVAVIEEKVCSAMDAIHYRAISEFEDKLICAGLLTKTGKH